MHHSGLIEYAKLKVKLSVYFVLILFQQNCGIIMKNSQIDSDAVDLQEIKNVE